MCFVTLNFEDFKMMLWYKMVPFHIIAYLPYKIGMVEIIIHNGDWLSNKIETVFN